MSDFTAMSSGHLPHSNTTDVDVIELQLQQELRSMFDVDTQQYLQTYMALVQQLQPERWAADIQEMYRTIHTIKGGAVTVGADAILLVATVLEDLLSDLRHLDTAPPLADGKLPQVLLEAGELLVGTTQSDATGDEAKSIVQPTVARIQVLRTQVQEAYLANWSEQSMLHQEFAQQGFGLVVLDLEILVESLSPEEPLTQAHLDLAQQTLTQLAEIGSDLEFASPWSVLLETCAHFTMEASATEWIAQWPVYFKALKQSAYTGGQAVDLADFGTAVAPPAIPAPQAEVAIDLETLEAEFAPSLDLELTALDLDDLDAALADLSLEQAETGVLAIGTSNEPVSTSDDPFDLVLSEDPSLINDLDEALKDLTTVVEDLANLTEVEALESPAVFNPTVELPQTETNERSALEAADLTTNDLPVTLETVAQAPEDLLDVTPVQVEAEAVDDLEALADVAAVLADVDLDTEAMLLSTQVSTELVATQLSELQDLNAEKELTNNDPDAWLGLIAEASPTASSIPETMPTPQPTQQAVRRPTSQSDEIRIPVPLGRLDRGAQYLVDTLLNARASQVSFRTLQSQLTQLLSLAQESSQYITRLRQIQDDYALLDALDSKRKAAEADGVALERYQQGYTTINRLLENSLRLSELGVEAEKTVVQTSDNLQSLDRTMAQLQQNIEQSRQIPFKNLSFRARAILRDLTNRLGKPARLVVHGEQMELDAGTLSRLEPVLLHLIRNALDHGLEDAAVRSQHQKPEQGTLTLTLRRRGNTFLLDLEDDGGGIDPEKIHQIAVSKGLPLTQTETPADLLAVICQSGFSSQTQVSDVSGRGVGMDVVAKQVESMGGRLSLDTTLGQGTTFQIQFPVPHMLVPCITVMVGNRLVALPTEDITTTNIIGNLQLTATSNNQQVYAWTVQQGDQSQPGFDLLSYWQPDANPRPLTETALGIAVKHPATGKTVWLFADDLQEQTDLLINPVPEPMEAPESLVGFSLLPNGKLAAVLEPSALAELVCRPQPEHAPQQSEVATTEIAVQAIAASTTHSTTRAILIVDDAALMRRRLEASLRAYGYETYTCGDGLDAWNWLQEHPTPALVITDVEMPNMDGFTLIDRCRQTGLTMPMLVVSSRLAEEWSKEAKRLGATDYLTKGFSTPDLIEKVKTLMAQSD